MRFFKNLRIGARLGAAFCAVLLLLVGIAGTAYLQLGNVFERLTTISRDVVPSLQLLGDIDAAATRARRYTMAHVLSNTPEAKAKADDTLRNEVKKVATALELYRATFATDPTERRLVDAFAATWGSYMKEWDELRPLSEAAMKDPARFDEARKFVIGPAAMHFQQVAKALVELREYNDKAAQQATAAAQASYSSARSVILAGSLMALLLAAAMAYLATRSITVPLRSAVAAANAIAKGDLSTTLHADRGDEVGQLIAAMAEMQANLQQLVGKIRSTVESVAAASTQIAQGNQDLSSRTEQQAASLQETAASMEELTSTVRHSADSSRTANQLAIDASSVAARGGDVMTQVVTTMEDISAASQKIAEIIGVIDGIAFQTNILALNAAVEAARAGEQGRGFAVVAGEVRTLAQRSGEAAREIKVLIESSVGKVDAGSTLVGEAGATMNEIVASVKRVADLIGEINAATREQSAGIDQISTAVNQLDQVTQQNAALVEESAAAAGSLREQALSLTEAVSVFQLADPKHAIRHAAAEPSKHVPRQRSTPAATSPRAPGTSLVAAASTAPPIPRPTIVHGEWARF